MRGNYPALAGNRCIQADWGFEAEGVIPGYTSGSRLSGWDGSWVSLPGESLLLSPPIHVHVEIEAWLRPLGDQTAVWEQTRGAHPITDALLNPKRAHAVSLGWVHWYGIYGHLVLAPAFPFGGELGGHLILYGMIGRTSYAITLHAWMAALRLSGHGVDRVIRFQSGPALPHVIATLKSMVGSALRP